jgi:hypothetical protein
MKKLVPAPHSPAVQHQTCIQRRDELARLLPLWPNEIADLSIEGRKRIIATLERALRTERRRGKAGHWAYDLARHAALVRTWRNECAALRSIALQKNWPQQKDPPKGGPY